MFLGLPALNMVILPWNTTGLRYLPLLFYVFFLLLTFVVLMLYSFILCSSLLTTSSLPFPCPVQSDVSVPCTWYFYHTTALGYDSPLLLFCFRLPVY